MACPDFSDIVYRHNNLCAYKKTSEKQKGHFLIFAISTLNFFLLPIAFCKEMGYNKNTEKHSPKGCEIYVV
jgi:hypothetical protein